MNPEGPHFAGLPTLLSFLLLRFPVRSPGFLQWLAVRPVRLLPELFLPALFRDRC